MTEKSSHRTISCSNSGGDRSRTVWTVLISVDQPSLWKMITTLAFGKWRGYFLALHLESKKTTSWFDCYIIAIWGWRVGVIFACEVYREVLNNRVFRFPTIWQICIIFWIYFPKNQKFKSLFQISSSYHHLWRKIVTGVIWELNAFL